MTDYATLIPQCIAALEARLAEAGECRQWWPDALVAERTDMLRAEIAHLGRHAEWEAEYKAENDECFGYLPVPDTVDVLRARTDEIAARCGIGGKDGA